MSESDKRTIFAFTASPLMVFCSIRMAFVSRIHDTSTLDGWYRGFDVFSGAATWAALSGIAAALAAWILLRFGSLTVLYLSLAATLVAAAAVESWHNRTTKAEQAVARKDIRDAYGLDAPLPPSLDFDVRVRRSAMDPSIPELDVNGRDWSLRYVYRRPSPSAPPTEECVGTLRPSEAVEFSALIEAAREKYQAGAPLCPDTSGDDILFTVRYAGEDGDWTLRAARVCIDHSSDREQLDKTDSLAQEFSYLIERLTPVSEAEERVVCRYLVTPAQAQRAADSAP